MTKKKETVWRILKDVFRKRHDYRAIYRRFHKRQGQKTDESQPITKNVYECGPNIKQYLDKQMKIRSWWKARLVEPLFRLSRLFLRKHFTTKVSDGYQFRNLKIWDTAFEEALTKWNLLFRTSLHKAHGWSDDQKIQKMARKCVKSKATKMLRTFKELINTGVSNDTAYMEFWNILMFEVMIQMLKNYQQELTENGHIEHVFYNSTKIDDVRYFCITGGFPNQASIKLNEMSAITIDLKKLLDQIFGELVKTKELKIEDVITPKKSKD